MRYTGQNPYRIRRAKLSRQTHVHTLLPCPLGKRSSIRSLSQLPIHLRKQQLHTDHWDEFRRQPFYTSEAYSTAWTSQKSLHCMPWSLCFARRLVTVERNWSPLSTSPCSPVGICHSHIYHPLLHLSQIQTQPMWTEQPSLFWGSVLFSLPMPKQNSSLSPPNTICWSLPNSILIFVSSKSS